MFYSRAGSWAKFLCIFELSLNNYGGLIDDQAGKRFSYLILARECSKGSTVNVPILQVKK